MSRCQNDLHLEADRWNSYSDAMVGLLSPLNFRFGYHREQQRRSTLAFQYYSWKHIRSRHAAPNALSIFLRFQDAGLIEHKTSGHCSYAAVSTCTLRAIRAYIRHGHVPPSPIVSVIDEPMGDWMSCEVDEEPWQHDFGLSLQDLDYVDKIMMETWRDLMEHMDRLYQPHRGFL